MFQNAYKIISLLDKRAITSYKLLFAKALSCLSLVEDGGKSRGQYIRYTLRRTLTYQTSLVMEEFLDSEVDNCSSSSFLYKKLSLRAEWLWFCGSGRLDMSPKLPLISPSQLKNVKSFWHLNCYYRKYVNWISSWLNNGPPKYISMNFTV